MAMFLLFTRCGKVLLYQRRWEKYLWFVGERCNKREMFATLIVGEAVQFCLFETFQDLMLF